jgi:hypothetical protein
MSILIGGGSLHRTASNNMSENQDTLRLLTTFDVELRSTTVNECKFRMVTEIQVQILLRGKVPFFPSDRFFLMQTYMIPDSELFIKLNCGVSTPDAPRFFQRVLLLLAHRWRVQYKDYGRQGLQDPVIY